MPFQVRQPEQIVEMEKFFTLAFQTPRKCVEILRLGGYDREITGSGELLLSGCFNSYHKRSRCTRGPDRRNSESKRLAADSD